MNIFNDIIQKIITFLPNLMAGFFVGLLGFFLAWVVLRLVVRVCIVLRLDRLLINFGLVSLAEKADVRHTLYQIIGMALAFPVLLVFINNSLIIWQLTVLSEFIHDAVLLLPRLLTAFLVAILGYLGARMASSSLGRTLLEENFYYARLVSNIVRWVLAIFFFAMALSVLDFARQIVLIAFSVTMISVGLAFVLAVGLGSKSAVERAWEKFRNNRNTPNS